MKSAKTPLIILIANLGVSAWAIDGTLPLSYTEGYVLWQPKGVCDSQVSFLYFDGRRVQSRCVSFESVVKPNDFVFLSRNSDCPGQVVVISGETDDETIYADKVDSVFGCSN